MPGTTLRTTLRPTSAAWLTRAALAVSLCLLASSASADDDDASKAKAPSKKHEKLAGEVLVILAREAAGEVDKSLSSIKALKEPPFSSFKSMKILSRSGVGLTPAEAVVVELPNGRRLRLEWLERTKDGRFKVQVSINRPSQQDYLPLLQVIASPGEPFFVAGQKHDGGTLVIGVRVGEKVAAD